ncbi:MAG: FAD synthetase family protein [Treponema sp.]|nr:FAD synthetase family protein [Treponema sp.]
MKIIDWKQFQKNNLMQNGKYSSMTIGVFDGVHRGHQELIRRVVSHNADYTPVVITFRENHKLGDRGQGLGVRGQDLGDRGQGLDFRAESDVTSDMQFEIQSFDERLALFETSGIEIAVVVDFTDEFRQMPGLDFLKIILEHGGAGFFAVGSGFRCGYKLDTDAAAIQAFFASHNIPAEIIPQVTEGSLPISSSRIRAAIASGDHELARAMLGSARC